MNTHIHDIVSIKISSITDAVHKQLFIFDDILSHEKYDMGVAKYSG